jgi:hypothetical protein
LQLPQPLAPQRQVRTSLLNFSRANSNPYLLGGWTTRELRTIIRGLDGINIIATDIVEVAPAYDTNAELTTMAAADVLYEVMTLMVKSGPLSIAKGDDGTGLEL